jgi:hypothetical protein
MSVAQNLDEVKRKDEKVYLFIRLAKLANNKFLPTDVDQRSSARALFLDHGAGNPARAGARTARRPLQ